MLQMTSADRISQSGGAVRNKLAITDINTRNKWSTLALQVGNWLELRRALVMLFMKSPYDEVINGSLHAAIFQRGAEINGSIACT